LRTPDGLTRIVLPGTSAQGLQEDPMSRIWDAIVVGARCAGSPLAMLLARRGYRVLVVDRAEFPSDTLSTHIVHPLAVAALERWRLLDRLVATGCPPIDTYAFDFGPVKLAGAPGTKEAPVAYCPRRSVLDAILVAAAREAGAEVRESFAVEELLEEDGRVAGVRGRWDGGAAIAERARVVVGADGRSSVVAASVKPERYHERPPVLAPYYAYWSGLPMNGRFEVYIRPYRGFGAAPTHDGLTVVVGGWPHAEFAANKKDVERHYHATIELVPEFADRLRGAKRESRIAGAPTPNYFTRPYGPGWALVGDAGYLKDPITAQGILDAFRDAELCAGALAATFSGARSYDDAMGEYQRARDEQVLAMYDYTYQLATLEPPPPEMQQLFGAMEGNAAAMDGFAQMNAGTISPATFLAPENVATVVGASPRL
jgi:2-polyprenyl-6-methoxyphenol hydroxylase-like FAD-dependent oxidoreductase